MSVTLTLLLTAMTTTVLLLAQNTPVADQHPSVELSITEGEQLRDMQIRGSIVNASSSPMNVVFLDAPFPFEVELFHSSGRDLLAQQRRESPSYRVRRKITSLRLEPGTRRDYSITLGAYLMDRGFPPDPDKPEKVRIYIATSPTGDSGTFSVQRSQFVEIKPSTKGGK